MEFGAQDKAGALHPGSVAADGTVHFRVEIAVRSQEDSLDFVDSFVHGPRQGRFLYLGYRPVGAADWTRRWKIPLAGITPALVTTTQPEGAALQAAFSTHKAATVQLLGAGWKTID